jgi:opacity protein-like surface antigen
LELVYWGVFPSDHTAQAFGNATSTIDFSDLIYNGASANVPFTNSALQQVTYGYNFNSVEANLVGNSWNGGPFGCSGRCGSCMGNGGSPWGWGYVAGFRYINFSEQFLFSADPNDTVLDGDPVELNYAVALNNNLFGFQLGVGLSYCVTSRLQAYAIGKIGVYNDRVTQFQKVYGTAGTALVNTGPFTGHPFEIRSERDSIASAGQFDLGGRWTITNNWSANFGYRFLTLAGVATADVNVRHGQFHDVDGLGVMSRNGSFLLHGAYAGVNYCW